jgi:hypothetical protein
VLKIEYINPVKLKIRSRVAMCRWASPAKSFLVSAPRWDLSVPEIDKITEHRKKFCNGEFLKYCHVVKYNRLKCDRKE